MKNSNEKTTLYFLGGLNSIGGNKIAVISGNGKGILLDFGLDFKTQKKYYSGYLTRKEYRALIEGAVTGQLPWPIKPFDSLYRSDYINHMGEHFKKYLPFTPPIIGDSSDLSLESENPPIITHLLISHAHLDHVGELKYLNENISVVCSETTRILLESLEEIASSSSVFYGILNDKERFGYIDGQTDFGGFPKRETKPKKMHREITAINGGKEYVYAEGGITAIGFAVDHSIPGATAYLIKDNITGLKMVYTGDLRKHGPNKSVTEEFINAAVDFKPDILICEGTRLGEDGLRNNLESEQMVQQKLKKHIEKINKKDPEKLILFDCSEKDLWRIASFYKAAVANKRTLVVPPIVYFLLKRLDPTGKIFGIDPAEIRVFLRKSGYGVYEPRDYSNDTDINKVFEFPEEKWPEIIDKAKKMKIRVSGTKPANYLKLNLDYDFIIRAEEISENQGDYIVLLKNYRISNLIDINPSPGAYYIFSKSEPFDDMGEIDEMVLNNWLDLFKIPNDNDHRIRIHCSGHMPEADLIEMITKINPKYLFPIHTEHAERYKKILDNCDCTIIIPERYKAYEFVQGDLSV